MPRANAAATLVPRTRRALEENDVDRAVLEWIARFRFVTADLLAAFLSVSVQAARARARRLAAEGLLARSPARPGAAITLSVTARGMRRVGLPPRKAPRSDTQREHELALVWLVVQLERRGSGIVYTERECRRIEGSDPSRRMSADILDPAGRPARRWPDLVLRRGKDLVVIELERTLKDPTRLARIVAGYNAASWFTEVRLLCADVAVARGVVAAVARAELPSWLDGPNVVVAPWPGLPPSEKASVRAAIDHAA